jgi:elongation factor G
VDSDEVSFKIAGLYAFRDAFLKAKPILLEPIYHLEITVPEEFMGDVMGYRLHGVVESVEWTRIAIFRSFMLRRP